MKAYALFIVIRSSDGDVKPGGPVGADKGMLMPAPGVKHRIEPDACIELGTKY